MFGFCVLYTFSSRGVEYVSAFLNIQDLSVRYGSRQVLYKINYSIPDRGIHVIMGPGGGGKSTLLKTLCLPRQMATSAVVSGNITRNSVHLEAPFPSIIHQQARSYQSTVREYLFKGHPRRASLLRTEQHDLINALFERYGFQAQTPDPETGVLSLDLFMRRVLSVFHVLLRDPTLTCIDEPLRALREDEVERFIHFLKQVADERALIVTTHHQRYAKSLASTSVLLAGGQLHGHTDAVYFFRGGGNKHVEHYLRTGGSPLLSPKAEPGFIEWPWKEDALYSNYDEQGVELPVNVEAEASDLVEIPGLMEIEIPGLMEVEIPAEVDEAGASEAGETFESKEPEVLMPPAPENETDAVALKTLLSPVLGTSSAFRGPRGFRWIIPGRLGGCPQPGLLRSLEEDLDALKRVSMTTLVTLTEAEHPQLDEIEASGIRTVFLPMDDMRTPEHAVAAAHFKEIDALLAADEVVIYHCRAGLGRTGLMLAGYLIWKTHCDAETAIYTVRSAEQGYIQSKEQELFLEEMAKVRGS